MYSSRAAVGNIIDFFFFYPNSLKCYKCISKCYNIPKKVSVNTVKAMFSSARAPAGGYVYDAVRSDGASEHLPIMPLTVPKSTEPWVGVELSPRFCSTSEPWQKTLTNSPRWKTPTSCRCCRSSSVVAALAAKRRRRRRGKERRINVTDVAESWHDVEREEQHGGRKQMEEGVKR